MVIYLSPSGALKVPKPYKLDGQFIAFWAAWSLAFSTFKEVVSAFF